jgi:hypothetical protein
VTKTLTLSNEVSFLQGYRGVCHLLACRNDLTLASSNPNTGPTQAHWPHIVCSRLFSCYLLLLLGVSSLRSTDSQIQRTNAKTNGALMPIQPATDHPSTASNASR